MTTCLDELQGEEKEKRSVRLELMKFIISILKWNWIRIRNSLDEWSTCWMRSTCDGPLTVQRRGVSAKHTAVCSWTQTNRPLAPTCTHTDHRSICPSSRTYPNHRRSFCSGHCGCWAAVRTHREQEERAKHHRRFTRFTRWRDPNRVWLHSDALIAVDSIGQLQSVVVGDSQSGDRLLFRFWGARTDGKPAKFQTLSLITAKTTHCFQALLRHLFIACICVWRFLKSLLHGHHDDRACISDRRLACRSLTS